MYVEYFTMDGPAAFSSRPQMSRSGPTCALLLVLLLAYVKKEYLSSFTFSGNLY